LSATGLALRRGREWLFRGLDLQVARGQLLWLRGANGSGKTSLLRVLVGLAQPEQGDIARAGDSGAPLYVGHTTALKEDLSAHEALAFLVRLQGRACPGSEIDAALQRLQVQHRSRRIVRTLSQGQRRRVALARLALAQSPSLWVLDEPFDALDSTGTDTVLDLLREHLQRGGGAVLTSHQAFQLPGFSMQTLDLDARHIHG
jgi:heme exporter protein A